MTANKRIFLNIVATYGRSLFALICGLSSLPMALLFFHFGMGLNSVGLALVIAKVFAVLGRLYYGHKLVNISAKIWIYQIFLPFVLDLGGTILAGVLPTLFLPASFERICLTTLICELTIFPLAWYLLLPKRSVTMLVKRCPNFLYGLV